MGGRSVHIAQIFATPTPLESPDQGGSFALPTLSFASYTRIYGCFNADDNYHFFSPTQGKLYLHQSIVPFQSHHSS
jgi:hypothetical protein